MPSHIRGNATFRPQSNTYGTANMVLDPMNTTRRSRTTSSVYDRLGDIDMDHATLTPPSSSVAHDDALLPPPSSSVAAQDSSTSHRSNDPPSSTGSKRKQPASTPLTTSSSIKRQRAGVGPAALNSMKESFELFGDKIVGAFDRLHTQRQVQQLQPNEPSDAHEKHVKSRAIGRMEELELDEAEHVALIDLFATNPDAADTYMSIPRDNIRKAWVRNQLTKLGFPKEG
jgi:hypothetical protein